MGVCRMNASNGDWRNWTDRLSAYWVRVELPAVKASLASDAEMLRRAEEESGERVEQYLFEQAAPDECEDIKFRHHMEAQRIARMGREFHGFLHLPPEVRRLIYECLLVVGDVFVPNSFDQHDGVEPLKKSQLHKPCGKPYYRYRHYNNSIVCFLCTESRGPFLTCAHPFL